MNETEKILSEIPRKRIIIQKSPNHETYYIDEMGNYVKSINHIPVDAGIFPQSYLSMAINRANLSTAGFNFELWSTENYDAFLKTHDILLEAKNE